LYGVIRASTIRRLIAMFVIAGLVWLPISPPAAMAATDDGLAMAEMAADMPCCPEHAPSVPHCDSCLFMAVCAPVFFLGMPAASEIVFAASVVRVILPADESLRPGLARPPPARPPRQLI